MSAYQSEELYQQLETQVKEGKAKVEELDLQYSETVRRLVQSNAEKLENLQKANKQLQENQADFNMYSGLFNKATDTIDRLMAERARNKEVVEALKALSLKKDQELEKVEEELAQLRIESQELVQMSRSVLEGRDDFEIKTTQKDQALEQAQEENRALKAQLETQSFQILGLKAQVETQDNASDKAKIKDLEDQLAAQKAQMAQNEESAKAQIKLLKNYLLLGQQDALGINKILMDQMTRKEQDANQRIMTLETKLRALRKDKENKAPVA